MMLFRLAGEVICIFLDIILLLEPATGRGLMCVELRVGLEVALLILPCHPRLQQAAASEVGRVAMGPARFGSPELVYRPLSRR